MKKKQNKITKERKKETKEINRHKTVRTKELSVPAELSQHSIN
jgi:hypothetical protein